MGGITTTLFQRPRDPQYNLTTLLLPGNGTNGTQNNTFLDSSSNNFPITRNPSTGPNAPTQGSFSPFSQTGWSIYNASTGSVSAGIFLNGQSDFAFGTGDFTIELWIYLSSSGANQVVYDSRPGSTNGLYPTIYLNNSTTKLTYFTNSADRITQTSTFIYNTWHHVVVTRTGTSTKMFVDGTQEGSTYTDSNNYINGTDRPFTGDGNTATTSGVVGYISNLRVVKGSGPYQSAGSSITVPTSTLTPVTNTVLLTCQSNRFVDTNTQVAAKTINTFNSTSVQPFSPFAPSGAYTTTAVGGSGYFDGTGDYLNSTITAFGSGNFTIECWVYFTASVASKGIFHVATSSALPSTVSGVALASGSAGGWTLYYNNGSQNTTTTLTAAQNTWIHLAVVKSGTTIRVYVDGVMNQSQTDTANYTSQVAAIGGFFSTAYLLTGYISGFKVTSTADYSGTSTTTANFTLPTAPPSPTSSILCCNFTNAGITDATAKNDLETVGNAQISTTQSKFGGSSMSFDGTGDFLTIRSSPDLYLSTGPFTIEAWVYPNNTTTGTIVSRRSSANARGLYFTFGEFVASKFSFYAGDTNTAGWEVAITSSSTYSTGQWHHVAVTRDASNVFTLWVNGVSAGTATSSVVIADDTSPLLIGGIDNTGVLNGYIDDLRITKGFARYTANFNVPTIAFPTQ